MIHYIDTEIELDEANDYRDVTVTVEFDYTPAEREVWTLRNGNPGHPGCGEEISIVSVRDTEGHCYLYRLSEVQINKLTDFISNTKADY